MEVKKYKCGWCGCPTDKDGKNILSEIDDFEEEYEKAELVNGKCCEKRWMDLCYNSLL